MAEFVHKRTFPECECQLEVDVGGKVAVVDVETRGVSLRSPRTRSRHTAASTSWSATSYMEHQRESCQSPSLRDVGP
jgi:hypothetical protein